jgi:proton glutamate symport protein
MSSKSSQAVEEPTENTGAKNKRPSRTVVRVSSLAAVALFTGGVVAGLLHALPAFAAALRWCGLGLFLPLVLRKRSLLAWTFLAMVAGAELGADAPVVAVQTQIASEVFLRLIRAIVAPLIFGGIVTGIAGHGELKGVGRVAIKAIVFFEIVTTLGLILGLIAINISQAGVGVALPTAVDAAVSTAHRGWHDVLLNIFPENIALAVAQNQILQVAVFAVLFGAALATLPRTKSASMLAVLQSLTDVMFRITRIVMYVAPIAAGAALAYTVGSMGLATLLPLGKLIVTYYSGLLAFVLLVLIPTLLIARIPMRPFWAAVAEPAAIGFATTTSEAALPQSIENMEAFGVPRWMASFVIPTGYSFNLTGSSLYLSMAAIFAAQAGGIHMGWGEQLMILATLLLTSKGVAGVSRGSLVVLMATATTMHIPMAAVMMILGVDTLMDMGRTGMNVIGNCMAAAVVARWEVAGTGEY